jgi:hypothetical protein
MFNSRVSERLAVVGVINPADAATTAASTGWVDMGKFDRLVGLILVGAVTGTVDAKFQQATTSGGAGAKDVTGAAITQQAATADNKQQLVNLRASDLDVNGGFKYARLTVTPTGGTTNLLGAVVLGESHSGLATNLDAASVVEVV